MKKLLFLFLIMFLFSCEKKDECYECTTTITTTGSPYASDQIVSKLTSCGITEDEARIIEREMTSTVTSNIGGYNITVKEVTNCRKQ